LQLLKELDQAWSEHKDSTLVEKSLKEHGIHFD
jgi:hypothetical protein